MSREIAPFGVRMSEPVKTALEQLAKENNRSLNAEIVYRLEQSLSNKTDEKLNKILMILESR